MFWCIRHFGSLAMFILPISASGLLIFMRCFLIIFFSLLYSHTSLFVQLCHEMTYNAEYHLLRIILRCVSQVHNYSCLYKRVLYLFLWLFSGCSVEGVYFQYCAGRILQKFYHYWKEEKWLKWRRGNSILEISKGFRAKLPVFSGCSCGWKVRR